MSAPTDRTGGPSKQFAPHVICTNLLGEVVKEFITDALLLWTALYMAGNNYCRGIQYETLSK